MGGEIQEQHELFEEGRWLCRRVIAVAPAAWVAVGWDRMRQNVPGSVPVVPRGTISQDRSGSLAPRRWLRFDVAFRRV